MGANIGSGITLYSEPKACPFKDLKTTTFATHCEGDSRSIASSDFASFRSALNAKLAGTYCDGVVQANASADTSYSSFSEQTVVNALLVDVSMPPE